MKARRTLNGHHVICGYCRAVLCRRDFVNRADGEAAGYYLVWGDGWRPVVDREIGPARTGHIERTPGATARLAQGRPPGRGDWLDPDRLELSRALRSAWPADCERCGKRNDIDFRKLDVLGIAARPYTG